MYQSIVHHSQEILSAPLSFKVGWGDVVAEYVAELEELIECCLISSLLRDLLWDRWNFIITSAINDLWLLVEENFTWPRTPLLAAVAAKEETVEDWEDGYFERPKTTELADYKMDNLNEMGFFLLWKIRWFCSKIYICSSPGLYMPQDKMSGQKKP